VGADPEDPGGRDPQPDPRPSAYTNGVVTPHAAFLALRFAQGAVLHNLEHLARDFPGLYGQWGFRDSVNVSTGAVSSSYLSLDQGMIMGAIGNALGGDMLRKAFTTADVEDALRPVIGIEQSGARLHGGG
jgi:Putative glucoamylase